MKTIKSKSDLFLRRTKDSNYILIALCLALLFFFPFIFSEKTFFFRDIHLLFYPMKTFLAESLKNGSIPYWCSNVFCGAPFISDIQSGVFYPISLIFMIFPFPLSFNLFVILHFFLGFIFFNLFIREIGLSRQSALITSISYCYGSYTISSVNTLNNLTTLVWLPAILWSFKRASVLNQRSMYFVTLFFLCMSILGGEPQLFILGTGVLFLFSFAYMPQRPSEKAADIKAVLTIICLLVSAALLTMVQLGPTFIDYQHSVRLDGLTYEDANKYTLNPGMLKYLVVPLTFESEFSQGLSTLKNFFPTNAKVPWLLTIYPGLIIAPLALFGLFFNFSKKLLLWFITFFITLILALGDTTPIHYVFYRLLPFFRFSDKFMFLASFSLLVMAAYGIEQVILIFKAKGIRISYLMSMMALLLVADLYSAHRNINPSCESSFYQYHHPALQPILKDSEKFRIHLDPKFIDPPSIQGTINNNHIRWQATLSPNLGIVHGLDHVGGISGLELRYQYIITEILARPWAEKIHFLRLANVKYIISNQRLNNEPGIETQIEKINALVYRIRDFLPRAWMVGDLKTIRKGTADELLDGSFDPRFSALTKSDIISKYQSPYFKEVDDIRYEKCGRIQVELTAKKPGILILSETSYPGWRVFVDGKEKECLWLNLLFQGVEIEKGYHKVEFVYHPKYFLVFLSISLSVLTLFLFLWSYILWSERRRKLTSHNSTFLED